MIMAAGKFGKKCGFSESSLKETILEEEGLRTWICVKFVLLNQDPDAGVMPER
jgi:hypothetical protein